MKLGDLKYGIDLNVTQGFYFSLQVFDLRLPHKKLIKIWFYHDF